MTPSGTPGGLTPSETTPGGSTPGGLTQCRIKVGAIDAAAVGTLKK